MAGRRIDRAGMRAADSQLAHARSLDAWPVSNIAIDSTTVVDETGSQRIVADRPGSLDRRAPPALASPNFSQHCAEGDFGSGCIVVGGLARAGAG